MDDEKLERVFEKYPKLRRIVEAIQRYNEGQQGVVNCLICEQPLTVTKFAEIGSLWVTCPNKCTWYHENWQVSDE